jgi:hypothetical protein
MISLFVNLGSDHTFAKCGRRTIDAYSSKSPVFMENFAGGPSKMSLPILNPSVFRLLMPHGQLQLNHRPRTRYVSICTVSDEKYTVVHQIAGRYEIADHPKKIWHSKDLAVTQKRNVNRT